MYAYIHTHINGVIICRRCNNSPFNCDSFPGLGARITELGLFMFVEALSVWQGLTYGVHVKLTEVIGRIYFLTVIWRRVHLTCHLLTKNFSKQPEKPSPLSHRH